MIKPRVLSQQAVSDWLQSQGFTKVGHINVSSGDYSVWVTEWGEPLMIPEDGPDKVCADFILKERAAAVLATGPRHRKK